MFQNAKNTLYSKPPLLSFTSIHVWITLFQVLTYLDVSGQSRIGGKSFFSSNMKKRGKIDLLVKMDDLSSLQSTYFS